MKPDQDNKEVHLDAKVRMAVEPLRINLGKIEIIHKRQLSSESSDQDTAFHLVRYFTDLSQLSIQDCSVDKSMSCSSHDPSGAPTTDNSPKEIFFKEINFSPDLSVRIDYQVEMKHFWFILT